MGSELVRAVMARQVAARSTVLERLVASLMTWWGALPADGRYDDAAVADWARRAAAQSQAARRAVAASTRQAMVQVLRDVGARPPRSWADLPDPRGVDPVEVWQRPARTYRRARLVVDEAAADRRAATRLQVMASDDVAMAARDASSQVLRGTDGVTGWRRMVHPAASDGGVCGLCVAASTRVYSLGELLPLHSRCGCTVSPIVGGRDPGGAIADGELGDLYDAAGGTTSGVALASVRVQIAQHGELGPILREAGHRVTGPAEAARREGRAGRGPSGTMTPEWARHAAEMARDHLASLRARAAAGEPGLEGPITWHLGSIERLERIARG